jgi:flagellar biosynthesis/type III secretory pathway chaperone
MSQSASSSDSLLQLLTFQLGLLDQLIEIGHAQIGAIENGRMSELFSLLSEKQPLIAELGDTSQRIRDLNRDGMSSASENDASIQQCRRLKEQAQQHFNRLFELEKKSEILLTKSRDQIARRLEESSHSMTAISAYQSGSAFQSQGGQLDLSSGG